MDTLSLDIFSRRLEYEFSHLKRPPILFLCCLHTLYLYPFCSNANISRAYFTEMSFLRPRNLMDCRHFIYWYNCTNKVLKRCIYESTYNADYCLIHKSWHIQPMVGRSDQVAGHRRHVRSEEHTSELQSRFD